MSDVIAVKLISGDEIIGRVKKRIEETDTITITKPLAVTMTPQGGGALIPFMLTAEADEVTLQKSAIAVLPTPCNKQVSDLYIQQTTGIVLTK